MSNDDVFRAADRAEVEARIPSEQEAEMRVQHTHFSLGEREVRGEAGGQGRAEPFEAHAFEARLRYTSRTAMAAGVTPGMRDACPRVSGRTRVSFCLISVESPGMRSNSN